MITASGTLRLLFTGTFTSAVCAGLVGVHAVTGEGEYVRRLERAWATGLARAWRMDVRVHGASQLDPAGTYVYMANHQSHVDIVALILALPRVPGFLAKKELRRVPFFGAAMEVGGHVFVDRSAHARAVEAIEEAARAVREGASIVVFPEGTRHTREAVSLFKKGGFHLALAAGVPIVPIGLRGTRALLPRHSKMIRPGAVDVHIGAPIPAAELAALGVEGAVTRVRAEVAALAAMPLDDTPQPRRTRRAR
jgi:1-acyl-sn-glycerol-3-phosphate acyltransferase